MNNRRYVEEIVNMLRGEAFCSDLLCTRAGERCMEDAVLEILRQLVDTKNSRSDISTNSDDAKLLYHFNQIKGICLRRERADRKCIQLSPALTRLFMEGVPEESASIKSKVVENAEEWICIVRKMHEEINRKTENFAADKVFWENLYERIAGARNFTRSDEYQFLLECLQCNGNIVLMYTMENLFHSDKLYKLTSLFVAFYSGLDCSVCVGMHGASDIDYSKITNFLTSLEKVSNQPRVIRRVIYRLINNFREDILILFCAKPHCEQLTVFRAFNELVRRLTENGVDSHSQCSTIIVEDLHNMNRYMWDVEQICRGLLLCEGALLLGLDEYCTEMEDRIEVYAQRYKCRINSEKENIEYAEPDSMVSIEDCKTTRSLIEKAIGLFNEDDSAMGPDKCLEPGSIEDLLCKMGENTHKYSVFLGCRQFIDGTKEKRTGYLHKLNDILLSTLKSDTPEGIISGMARTELITKITMNYEDEILLGSLESMIECTKKRAQEYLKNLPVNVLDIYVITNENSKLKIGKEESERNEEGLAIQQCGESSQPPFSDLHFNCLSDLFYTINQASVLNEYFKMPHITKALDDVALLVPDHDFVRGVYEEYYKLTLNDGLLFRSSVIEEFLCRFINLRWKHVPGNISEEKRTEITDELRKLEINESLFLRMFDELLNNGLVELYGNELYFQVDPSFYVQYFLAGGFDDVSLRDSLERRMSKIASVYCDVLIDKLSGSLFEPKTLGCSFSMDYSMFDEFHRCCQEHRPVHATKEYIDAMHKLLMAFSTEEKCIKEKCDKIRGVFIGKWDSFIRRCFILPYDTSTFSEYSYVFREYILTTSMIISYFELFRSRKDLIDVLVDFTPACLFQRSVEAINSVFDYTAEVLEDAEKFVSGLPSLDDISAMSSLFQMALFLEHKEILENVETISWFYDEYETRTNRMSINQTDVESIQGRYKEDILEMLKKYMDEASLKGKQIETSRSCINTLKLKEMSFNHFEAIPLVEIEMEKKRLVDEIGMVTNMFKKVSFESSTFAKELDILTEKKNRNMADVKQCNRILKHYELEMIRDSSEINIEEEYLSYTECRNKMKEFVETRVDALTDGEYFSNLMEFINDLSKLRPQTEDFEKMCIEIESWRKAIVHLEDLMRYPKYFDLKASLGEYLEGFDGEKAAEIVRLGRSDKEILEYLEAVKTGIFSRMKTNEDGMVVNFIEVKELVFEEWSAFEIVTKFNLHGLYLDRLNEERERIRMEEELIISMEEIQSDICGLMNVFSKIALFNDSTEEYNALRREYESILRNIDQAGTLDRPIRNLIDTYSMCIKRLGDLRRCVCALTGKLRSFLDTQRNEAPRLFYVSDKQMIMALNGTNPARSILLDIFNIHEVYEENGHIIGAGAAGEKILFKQKISLNQDLSLLVKNFEREIVEYLRLCFEAKRTGEIQMIDDLLVEYKYFNEENPESNNTIDVLNRLSKKYPDAVSLYPKHAIIDGALHVGGIPYMFEYYPPTSFIFTSLTSKIFSSIVLNFHRSGVVLYGPSGTGKTETVRQFCRTLGHPLYTFCCSEHVEYSSIRNIIVGCAKLSSFICFDEFNRLTDGVMSAVANCLYEYKDRIKVFLTMNIGYSGRHNLPRSLRVLFGEICVDNPDRGDIVQYHTGTRVLHDFLADLQSQCSNEPHYDFGLRAMNSIVEGGKGNIIENLTCFYMAMLVSKDRQLLVKLLKKHYSIEIDMNSKDYTPKSLLRKALVKRRGVILCGDGGMEMFRECLDDEPKVYLYNPSNLLLLNQSIFGTLDGTTGEWKDSQFIKDLRRAAGSTWFVFDGIGRSEWIEDFNSILDDNKTVCLSTGERIKVSTEFKFAFITESLNNITLATLTRVFFMHAASSSPVKLSYFPIEDFPSVLLRDRVVFLAGKRGVGKKAILERARGVIERHSSHIVSGKSVDVSAIVRIISSGSRILLYIDEFASSTDVLQEIVKEFYHFGTISSKQHRELKILCAFDCEGGELEEASRIMKKIVGNSTADILSIDLPDIQALINRILFENIEEDNLEFRKKAADGIGLIYKEMNLSIHELNKFLNFIKIFGITDERVIYALKLFYGERESLECRLLSLFGNSHSSRLLFNPVTCEFEECDCDLNVSRICCLLFYKMNVVIRGPRLSGKRTLLEEGLRILNRPDITSKVKIFHWLTEADYYKKEDGICVFLTLDQMSKHVHEQAVEILVTPKLRRFDAVKYLKKCEAGKAEECSDDSDDESDMGIVNNELNSPVAAGNSMFVINVDGVYRHPDSCVHEPIVFESLYKFIDYKATLKAVYNDLRKEVLERQAFLRRGTEKIEWFRKEAVVLAEGIAEKKIMVGNEICIVNKMIERQVEEEAVIRSEEMNVNKKRSLLKNEIEVSKEKKNIIDEKLKAIEPLLSESKDAISKITKAHLSEIKAMSSPPSIIKHTIEMVHYLLEGRRVEEWKELLLYIKRDDFINKILNYDKTVVNISKEMKLEYPVEFSTERAEKASRACGALFRWATACIEYHRVLRDVMPLKNEVRLVDESIDAGNEELRKEESKLGLLKEQIGEHRKKQIASQDKLEMYQKEIKELERRMSLLEEAVEKLKYEPEKWAYVECECPIRYMEEGKFIKKYGKNGYIKASDLHLFDMSGYIEISLNERNYRKALDNARQGGVQCSG